MREILFRGKHKDSGEWVEGVPYFENNQCFMITDLFICEEYQCTGAENVEAISETVGQYTGLTDKNGKRIFEGDIVKADDFIFAVKYGKCGGVANADNYGYMGFYLEPFSEATKLHARYGLRNDICYFDNIEIINNIHDNPELLKGGEQE